MSITLTITEETPQAVANALVGMAIPFMRSAAAQAQPAPAQEKVETPETKVVEGEVIPPTKKREKKADKKADEPKQTDIEDKITEVKDAPAECKIEDVRVALKELGESKGTDAVFELLGEYKVKNATEAFNAGKGAEIVKKANELAAA